MAKRVREMIYAIYVALVFVAFLTMLNGFLRGAKKEQLDAVFGILLLGLIITSFFVAGWKFGLLAIAVSFISAFVTHSLAARVASRLLSLSTGGKSGGHIGLPPKTLRCISHELGHPIDLYKSANDFLRDGDRRSKALDALLDYCERQAAIQEIMQEFQLSRDDLRELYEQLVSAGAGQWACGHWVAASAVAYPEALRYALTRRGRNIMETAGSLIMYFEQGMPLQAEVERTVEARGGPAMAKWWCKQCDLDFNDDAQLQARCPKCGTADYRVMRMHGKERFVLMGPMTEELMSVTLGLGVGFSESFGFLLYALAFAGAIQIAAIVTRSEHYLSTKQLTLSQGNRFNILHFFTMGFIRNLVIIVAVAAVVVLIRRLFF